MLEGWQIVSAVIIISVMEKHKAHNQQFFSDIKSVIFLFKRFLRPYSIMILGLVALNVATASIQAVLPLSVAPAVNIILGESKNAADSVSHITLDNIGPTLTMHFGIDPNDFLSIIVLVSSLYIVLTISLAGLKTIAMFLSAHISGTNPAENVIPRGHAYRCDPPKHIRKSSPLQWHPALSRN